MKNTKWKLSFAQKEILELEEYYKDSSMNNIGGIISFVEDTKVDLIIRAIKKMIENQPNIRLRLTRENNEYFQYYSERTEEEIDYFDFCDKQQEYDMWRDKELNRSLFHCNKALYRFTVITLPKGTNVLFFNISHLLTDGWGMCIIFNMLSEFIINHKETIFVDGLYTNCLEKEAQYLKSKKYESDRAYWNKKIRNYYDGNLFNLNNNDIMSGKSTEFVLSLEEMQKIEKYCKISSISISNFLTAIFMFCIGRCYNKKKVSIGYLTSNRRTSEDKKILGTYSRVLPLLIDIDEEMSISSFIENVYHEELSLLKHHRYPYSKIVEENSEASGLLDFEISFQDSKIDRQFSDKGVKSHWEKTGKFVHPLTLYINNRSNENHLIFEYDYLLSCFNENQVHFIHRRFMNIVKQFADNPQKRLKDIDILDEKEYQMVYYKFNQIKSFDPCDKTIAEIFEDIVYKYPKKIALKDEKGTLTYEELNYVSNRIALKLRASKIGRNDLVAMVSDRSREFIAAMIGIIKAGGAFIPIDQSNPSHKIEQIIKDSKAKVYFSKGVKFDDHLIWMNLEEIDWKINEGCSNPKRINKTNDLVYVIYTSGTTGKPKGVMIEQRSLCNYISFGKNNYVKDEIVVPFFTSISFDLTETSVFLSLLSGGRVDIYNGESMDMLKEIFSKDEYTCIKLTPSHLKAVNMLNCKGIKTKLETLILGGENLLNHDARIALDRLGSHIKLHNEYGPTETTIGCCDYIFDYENDRTGSMLIGKPINNMKIYVMNGNHLCGIDMVGELCISGEGLARGYINNTKANDEKFIINPHTGERMYCSGDIACWTSDGQLKYLGRNDEQVKIRGHRIEMAEIEDTLKQLEGIDSAAVIAKEDSASDRYLCAYIVSEKKINLKSLQSLLKLSLSDYMIPQYMIQMNELPLTGNGKVDKKALYNMDIKGNRQIDLPQNDTEEVILQKFREILGRDDIGTEDDFFINGGHSLKAMRLVSEMEDTFGIHCNIRSIFKNTTVRQLATLVINEEDSVNIINKAKERDVYPMSSAQKRLFLINEIDENNIAYNVPFIVCIDGEFHLEMFRKALNAVVNRNDILRTEFDILDGIEIQRVRDEVSVNIDYVERKSADEIEIHQLAEEFIQPFQLRKAPLIHVQVIKVSEDRHYLMMDIHHIICDGESLRIFLNELSQQYQGVKVRKQELQFKDYVLWANQRELKEQKKYWVDQFSDQLPILDLPYDYPRPLVPDYAGEKAKVIISEDLKMQISVLAEKTGTTNYMIYLSTWMILLSKYSRQEDIVVGTPVVNRPAAQLQHMMGMFVNTLALRSQPEQKKVYLTYLSEIREMCLAAYDNQEYAFEDLIQEIDVKRDLSRNPLFDVMIAFQDRNELQFNLTKTKSKLSEIKTRISKFDMLLEIIENEEEFSLCIEYSTSLFKYETIEWFLCHFVNLLEDILKHPNRIIGELSLMDKEERNKILTEFNATDIDLPINTTMVEIFENSVQNWQERNAVIFNDIILSYKNFNRKVNNLAHHLRKMGVTRNVLVPIIAERSIEMLAGLYAVMKAGGAYVPIDSKYPKERIEYIIRDCSAEIVLIYKAEYYRSDFIDLADGKWWEGNDTNLPRINKPEDLLYVIYTSGTTGNPKGVMIEHKSVINRILWMQNSYPLNERDTIMQKTAFTFDVSVWELFWWGMAGAKVALLAPGGEKEPDTICHSVNKYGVTVMHFVPSMLNSMISFLECNRKNAEELSSLKYVFASGEALEVNSVIKFYELFTLSNPFVKLSNLYGPTEASIDVSYYNCIRNEHKIPIGKPIYNNKLYIMDANNLCGIGIPGELRICGIGLAGGYLNQKELTAEKFVNNPFGEGRMYKSGDLVRWLPDGNIEYLGRMDEQVKIRGFRIELGEIESKLMGFAEVKECAVAALKDPLGEQAIHAYLVSNHNIDIEKIRNELRRVLPEYMIPLYIMQIQEIPVTRNGKLDKKGLPVIQGVSKEYVAPANGIQKELCQIFSDILGVEEVGINDSFFELGGHSLRATKLMNRIDKNIGCRVSLKDIFSFPTVKQLGEMIGGRNNGEYQPIPKAEKFDYYPMSSTQKRIYLASQMGDGNISYNMFQCIKLEGEVKIEVLKDSINSLIKRHEILRTKFMLSGVGLVQEILGEVQAQFEYVTDEKTSEKDLMDEFVKPFEFEKTPLIRTKLVKRRACYLLLFDMHHIIGDGESVGIMIKELSSLYNGEKLEPLSFQYKDYSEWMRKRDLSIQKEYWKSIFKDEIPVLDLPLDYIRPQVQKIEGELIKGYTQVELGKKIHLMAQKYGVTEYMIFLSAIMILFSKYSRQEDIIIGSPISARTHKDTESMLGMFVNTLAMRGKPERKKEYWQFLMEIKESCLKAYENQEYPFEELLEELNINRELSRNPLFDVMFVLQNNDKPNFKFSNVKADMVQNEKILAKFDLTFRITQIDLDYQIELEYCTKLFKEESVLRFLSHLLIILDQVVSNPRILIGDIEQITEKEKLKILNEFNHIPADYPRNLTLIDLFESQCKKTPEKTAIVYKDTLLSYYVLNQKANVLANKLRMMGVKPGDYIAITAERSIEMIIAIFAVLKSGAAYVPIDPNYPKERIKYMLEDCKPKVILNYRLSVDAQNPILDLSSDNIWSGIKTNPEKVNKPEDVAYVIYTSGTTGKPKGVMVMHKNVVQLFFNGKFQFDFNCKDVFLMFHSYAFDFSVWEMYGAALFGGKLIIPTLDDTKDNKKLSELILKHRITVLNQVPSSFYNLQTADQARDLNSIRYLIFGGEALNPRRIEDWHLWHKKCKIINMYGITETTVHVTYHEIKEEEIERRISNIGCAIPTLSIYIMDGDKLCGIGVQGELCVTGAGVAKGYLNQDELTKERFTKNLFGDGRMYRSGDLARWLPDGSIEYLGRMDEQVKIRGFRIELGEVESKLKDIEVVRDCVAVVKEDVQGEPAIYGYIVSDNILDIECVRNELRKTLPEYMIPLYMMQIGEIPITENGKLNRKELPIIEGISKAYVAPGNDVEKTLCQIFSDVLGVDQVGINDSFFELGGHSLRATKIVNRIEEKIGCRIYLKEIFLSPTVKELGKIIEGRKEEEYIPIPNAKKENYYLMSSTQKRIYLVNQISDKNVSYNMYQCLRLTGNLNIEALKVALYELIKRHEILRTRFWIQDGKLIQEICEEIQVDFEHVKDKQTSESKLMEGFVRPFNLEELPLLRVKLVERNDCYLLMFDMHHIIGDGMSVGIMIEELSTLYNGKTIEPVSLQYKDYSEWMRGRDLSEQKAYWKSTFDDEIPVLNMPLDYRRPQQQSFEGAITIARLGSDLSRKLCELGKAFGVTEYMVFLTATMILLGKYSGQEDIIIGNSISARTHKDMERMLGMFVNTLAMRGSPKKEITVHQFLMEIKETCLKAYENQEYPFENLIEELNISRDVARNPLFDVMMTLQNNDKSDLCFEGVETEILKLDNIKAKFDLSFDIHEENGEYIIHLEYCTHLYSAETADRLLEHYLKILKQLINDPGRKIKDIEVITKNEKDIIMNCFNNTKRPYPDFKSILDLFEEQVKKVTDKVAIILEDKSITYEELDARANMIGHELLKYDVKTDDFVVIMAEKSIETIIGILGILKAGCAYIPVDIKNPPERISYIIKDCKPKAIITFHTKVISDYPVIIMNENFNGKRNAPIRATGANNIAYVMYTSGTTGKPKGSIIINKNVVRLVKNPNYVRLDENTVILQTGSIAFDASTFEIWGTLLNGGTLVLAKDSLITDSKRLKDYLQKYNVNMMWLTSSLFNQLINSNLTLFDELRDLLIGGEQLSTEHVKKLKMYNKKINLINGYGPTENTTFTTTYKIKDENDKILIGKPIQNTGVFIMMDNNLCGIGVPGELCTFGDGLGKGYLNHPELTKKKFIVNPYNGEKLYCTGDLARWMPDGNIEYLGRLDSQIKIRGYRIELEEIEKVIKGIALIDDCAVLVNIAPSGEKAIYAYVVSKARMDKNDIKMELLNKLPAYMIPSFFVMIDQIPLTINGKVDKKEILQIEVPKEQPSYFPQTDNEIMLSKIFQTILKVDSIDLHDKFFDLGGHSLSAVRLINEIQNEMGYYISLHEIFTHQTIYEIADLIHDKMKINTEDIYKTKDKEDYPLSLLQQNLWVSSQLNEYTNVMNLVYPFIIENYDRSAFIYAVTYVMSRYQSLRTRIHIKSGTIVQSFDKRVQVLEAIEEISLQNKYERQTNPEEFLYSFIEREAKMPIPLYEKYLINWKIYTIGNGEVAVLVKLHHIIADDWSVKILFRDLFLAYQKKLDGHPVECGDLEIQTQDYIEWELRKMESNKMKDAKLYWMSILKDPIKKLEFIYDFDVADKNYYGRAIHIKFQESLKNCLYSLAKENNTTLFTTVISIVNILLYQYTGQKDIAIGSVFAQRNNKFLEEQVGYYLNTVIIRNKIGDGESFKEFFETVISNMMKVYQYQEYPFSKIISNYSAQNSGAQSEYFNVLIQLINDKSNDISLNDLMINCKQKIKVIELEFDQSKYDMVFNFYERNNELDLRLEYSTQLFKDSTMKRLCNRLENIIQQVSNNPDIAIEKIKDKEINKISIPILKRN